MANRSGTEMVLLGERPRAVTTGVVPHVVAWNLTRRCNLQCAHCYISAGPNEDVDDELSTAECLRIADEILELNASPMFILSGGEPLLREDLPVLARHAASRGATVVVGTNGTLLTEDRIHELKDAGVTGVAVSVESLDANYHDRFRHGHGSHEQTVAAVERLATHGLDFVVQTTITKGNRAELAKLVEWAAERGAVSFNAYFLVATGRATRMSALAPDEKEESLRELVDLHVRYLGRMMVRAKCAPQFMRLVYEQAPSSPVLNYSTRCPCGIHYCRVTPDGKLTACPYLPVAAGDLRRASFRDVWTESPVFHDIRGETLGGRCGRCAYRAICGGCRASAYAASGDYLAEDPACRYEPQGTELVIEPVRDVTYGADADHTLTWTPEALARVQRIPSFVRGVVVKRIEDYAQRQGVSTITAEMMQRVRQSLPVDFSKRMPFFLRND